MFDVVKGSAWLDGTGVPSNLVRTRARKIRLKLAINLFKRYILGASHTAGDPQVDLLYETALGARLFELIDERTWASWFDDAAPVPKRRTIQVLDHVAAEGIRFTYTTGSSEYCLAPDFFQEMVHGGLVAAMGDVDRSKRLKLALSQAVEDYVPRSAWHLHLDAMEVSSLAEGLGSLPWWYVKGVAADRLMRILHRLWSPAGGAIYKSFASDFRLEWDAATLEQRQDIEKIAKRFSRTFVQHRMDTPPEPRWASIGIEDDAPACHVHKVLFAIAGDSEFFKADRLHPWAFDLATSALAMHALAWTDRFRAFGFRVESVRIYWQALSMIFFAPPARSWDEGFLRVAATHLQIPWSERLHQVLKDARHSYLNEIASLGVAIEELVSVARHATDVHRLVYRGDDAVGADD
jgi:hypothetical protein